MKARSGTSKQRQSWIGRGLTAATQAIGGGRTWLASLKNRILILCCIGGRQPSYCQLHNRVRCGRRKATAISDGHLARGRELVEQSATSTMTKLPCLHRPASLSPQNSPCQVNCGLFFAFSHFGPTSGQKLPGNQCADYSGHLPLCCPEIILLTERWSLGREACR
jgi:hypothetical protein